MYAEDCIAKRGTDPVTKKQVLTHCCAATGSIVGVNEFSFGLFSYFSPPFGIFRRASVFAKRGTDPCVRFRQAWYRPCHQEASTDALLRRDRQHRWGNRVFFRPLFIFFVSFRHLSVCVRIPRASVSSLYFSLIFSYSTAAG